MASLSLRFNERLKTLVAPGERILTAFSGGKDSTALLSLLWEARKDAGIEVCACHVHHGIRGTEADRDEAFCRAFCKERGIPFLSRRANVPAFCKEAGVGLEEGARMERYRLLRAAAKEMACEKIATAHTENDQAETVLFHLARGAGMAGVVGIRAQHGDLIRPLLPFSSREILAYLSESGLSYTEDGSNEDLSFTRNRIRREILPGLEEAVPGCGKALARFSRIASRQDAFVKKCCDIWFQSHQIDCRSGCAPLTPFSDLARDEADHPLLYEALSRMIKNEDISINQERFCAVLSLLKNGTAGKIMEIGSGFSFWLEKDRLCFGHTPVKPEKPSFEVPLKEGENRLDRIEGVLTVSAPRAGKVLNFNKNLLIIHAAFDRIDGELFAREIRPGDRIQMDGMARRVKKMLCDAGFSQTKRARLPAVCDNSGIFWIPGLGLCDRARDGNAETVFDLSFRLCEEKIGQETGKSNEA